MKRKRDEHLECKKQKIHQKRICKVFEKHLELEVCDAYHFTRGREKELQAILEREGILILRDVFPAEDVLAAQAAILHEIEEFTVAKGALGVRADKGKPSLLSQPRVSRIPCVHHILEHPNLVHIMKALFNVEEILTTSYKWLRAVSPEDYTGLHFDRVYMGGGSQRLLTAWIPFCPVSTANGGLIWLRRSHRDARLREALHAYIHAPIGLDGTSSGWLESHPSELGNSWATHDFRLGSVAIFGLDLLHQTIPNLSKTFRISCDTRWQPAGDAKDPRLRDIRKYPRYHSVHCREANISQYKGVTLNV